MCYVPALRRHVSLPCVHSVPPLHRKGQQEFLVSTTHPDYHIFHYQVSSDKAQRCCANL